MAKCWAFVVGAVASLIAVPVAATEPSNVRIPNQAVSVRTWEAPDLLGVFQDGEYAGVQFHAVPDALMPLPPKYRPETLLAKLDPALKVESVGSPAYGGPKTREEIQSALPNTAFRVKALISADGRKAISLGEPAIPVYVAGYRTSPAYQPSLDDLMNARFKDVTRVYISGYDLSFGKLPSCASFVSLCTRK